MSAAEPRPLRHRLVICGVLLVGLLAKAERRDRDDEARSAGRAATRARETGSLAARAGPQAQANGGGVLRYVPRSDPSAPPRPDGASRCDRTSDLSCRDSRAIARSRLRNRLTPRFVKVP